MSCHGEVTKGSDMHIEIWAGGGVDPCWYWHFKNKGRITANAEAFYSKANAIRAAKGEAFCVSGATWRGPFIEPTRWMPLPPNP